MPHFDNLEARNAKLSDFSCGRVGYFYFMAVKVHR